MTGSIWTDILLFVVFITVLSIGMFRLDTIMTSSRPKAKRRPAKFCGTDGDGKIILTDPDGRSVRGKRRG